MDRKGPLGGRENIEADFSSVSDRTAVALSRVCASLVAAGAWDCGLAGDQEKTLFTVPTDKFFFLDRIVFYFGINDGAANFNSETLNVVSGSIDLVDAVMANSPMAFIKWLNADGAADYATWVLTRCTDVSSGWPLDFPVLVDPIVATISNLVAVGTLRYMVFGTLAEFNQ